MALPSSCSSCYPIRRGCYWHPIIRGSEGKVFISFFGSLNPEQYLHFSIVHSYSVCIMHLQSILLLRLVKIPVTRIFWIRCHSVPMELNTSIRKDLERHLARIQNPIALDGDFAIQHFNRVIDRWWKRDAHARYLAPDPERVKSLVLNIAWWPRHVFNMAEETAVSVK